MKLLPKSPMENPNYSVGTGSIIAHNQEWLLFSSKRGKAVLHDKQSSFKT
jgi:hypothetical protein